MSDKLPQANMKDHTHTTARAIISAIPLVGSPAVEFFNSLIAPPLQKRRDKWFQDIADRLAKLESAGSFNVEDLGKSEVFVSTLMQASTIAIRNHRKEKLDALRNAILNTATGRSPGDTQREMFLGLVDMLTTDHIRILRALCEHQQSLKKDNFWEDSIQGLTNIALSKVPDLPQEDATPEIIVGDLCRRGLLNWHGEAGNPSFQHWDKSILVPFTQQFLKFIEFPESAN